MTLGAEAKPRIGAESSVIITENSIPSPIMMFVALFLQEFTVHMLTAKFPKLSCNFTSKPALLVMKCFVISKSCKALQSESFY